MAVGTEKARVPRDQSTIQQKLKSIETDGNSVTSFEIAWLFRDFSDQFSISWLFRDFGDFRDL